MFTITNKIASMGSSILKTKVVFSMLLLLTSLSVSAGNPLIEKAKADFKKVNTTYMTTASFSMSINYLVFDNHVNGNLIENKLGVFIKNNNQSYTKLLDVETIVNTKNTIVVNNEDKFLVITDTKKIELSPIQTNVDTLLKICKDIKVVELGTSERMYKLIYNDDENSEFSQIDISINLTDHTIKKMTLFYNQSMPVDQSNYYAEEKKPRLEITYKSFKKMDGLNPTLSELFKESNYLTLNNAEYKSAQKYSRYKVINQLTTYRLKKK